MAHDDEHGVASHDQERNLLITMLLNFLITAVEVAGGLLSGSLALLSDAMHNFSDGIAIIISMIAIRLSHRPRTLKHTFGLKRAELLAAIVNASTLIVISFFLIREAVTRFFTPAPVAGVMMLVVALVGLAGNLTCTLLLKKGSDRNINIRAAYLHLLSDAVSSVAVVVGGLCIMFFNIAWIDPLLTILISVYILKETYDIVKESIEVIMMSSPPEIDINGLRNSVEALAGVKNIHHIHLWKLNDEEIHFEAHIDVDDMAVSRTAVLQQQIEQVLYTYGRITNTTLQFECDVCEKKGLVG